MREVIIIPHEGEESDRYYREKIDLFTRHHVKVNEYIKNHNLNVEENDSIYLQGVALALRNFCVIDIDRAEFIVYLPFELTKEQYDWFMKYRSSIIHMDISVVSIRYEDDEYTIEHMDKSTPKQNTVNRLYKELKKKYKIEKEVDINGSKRR